MSQAKGKGLWLGPMGRRWETLSSAARACPRKVSSPNLALENKAKRATNLHDGEVVIIWPLALGVGE